jgi:hypothetical protein
MNREISMQTGRWVFWHKPFPFMNRRFPFAAVLLLAFLASTGGMRALSSAREWNGQLLSAIRQTIPNPPQHARNFFRLAATMYNAWAAQP